MPALICTERLRDTFMLSVIFQFIRWALAKFAGGVLIVTLALVGCGLWIFLKDTEDPAERRLKTVRAIEVERADRKAAMAEAQKRMDRVFAEISAEREKAAQVDKVLVQLRELESTWDKYTGDAVQQKANAQRIESLTKTRLTITAKLASLEQEFNRATWERDKVEGDIASAGERLAAAQEEQSALDYYVERTWNYEVGPGPVKLPLKDWALVALIFYFVGPTVWRLWLYFFVAPWIARGRPVRLAPKVSGRIEIGESKVEREVTLQPGERLWVKRNFLQASDGGATRDSRLLLAKGMPVTSMAAGLSKLVELRPSVGGGETRLALSNQDDPHCETVMVVLAEGAALVLRPSFLAGVVLAEGKGLKIRQRWQPLRWQSWVRRQFRYLEFTGPCRLIVAGSRGVKVELLSAGEDGRLPQWRNHPDTTAGFTPDLDYRPERVESFVSYVRGGGRLFDDLFTGQGIFLSQRDARKKRGVIARFRGGFMQLFGM